MSHIRQNDIIQFVPPFSLQAFKIFTRHSRWQSCHRGVWNHSGCSGPQPSTVSGCCLGGPAALLSHCSSLGPSPSPDLSSARHIDMWHHRCHCSPPIPETRGGHRGQAALKNGHLPCLPILKHTWFLTWIIQVIPEALGREILWEEHLWSVCQRKSCPESVHPAHSCLRWEKCTQTLAMGKEFLRGWCLITHGTCTKVGLVATL